MVGVCHVMGIGGRHGMALLLLTAVPVSDSLIPAHCVAYSQQHTWHGANVHLRRHLRRGSLLVLQVAQTAFVLSERYQCSTETVTATLILGLLLMLPHLLLVLWTADTLGLFQTHDTP